jgi:hypothetical protein
MIIMHASHILMSKIRERGTCSGHYLIFVAGRRENDLIDLGDLALPLLLEVGEKLLELTRLISLPTLFSGLSVRLKCLVLLLRDLLQSHHDDVLWINLERHV